MILKLFGLLTGSFAQYLAIGAVVLGIYTYHNHSIKSAAKTQAQLDITSKTIKVQNERIKKARRAASRVRAKRVRGVERRGPYRRD